jgi:hypothetical protein
LSVTLASHDQCGRLSINIVDVQTHRLRNTNSGAIENLNQRAIPKPFDSRHISSRFQQANDVVIGKCLG